MLLSIGMMIKNEEKHLRECLQSLMPLLDNIESELIIIDTGSTDDSVNIAKSFTDKVYFHSWNDNFSEMRNKVINYCTGELIMVIDGDEVLENPDPIINLIKSKDRKNFNTVLLTVKNLTDENDKSSFSLLTSPRIFRNDKDFHYEGVVHNQPIFKSPLIKLESHLIHYGYISSDKELMDRKFIRTTNLLKKELEKEPLNFYYWSQLSVSYAMHNENKKALDCGIKAFEILENSDIKHSDYMYVYIQLAFSYFTNKEYIKTIEICSKGITLKDGILDLYFYLAKSQMYIKDYKNAIKNYKEYLNIADNIEKFTDTSISLHTFGQYENIIRDLVNSYIETDDYESALMYSNKITDEKLIALNLQNVVKLCLKNKQYDYLLEYYNSHIVQLNYQKVFETVLESILKNASPEERFSVSEELKSVEGLYGVLNKVRYSLFKNEELNSEIYNYLESNVYFNNLTDYYGDLLYYLISHNVNICMYLSNLREVEFNNFFVYLKDKYDNFSEIIFKYLQEVEFDDATTSYKIKKSLERYSILTSKFNDEDFIKIFNQYLEDGTTYINRIYSKDIILNEEIYELKNEEEGFLLLVSRAISVKDSDKQSYIGYLRKALKVYPYMNRGIEYLLNQFNKEENSVNNELEQYKAQIKNTIKSLIENKRFEEAKSIISEYEQIVQDDVEIVLFNSQIALYEANNIHNERYKM